MATLTLFLIGVLSLICFDPIVTAYIYGDPSWVWTFVNLFTHMVSHANWEHLIGNYMFGAPFMLYLEYKLNDTKKFVRLFFALGFCAFALHTIFNSLSLFKAVGVIGSSGAIFGLIGAALTLYKGPKPLEWAAKMLLAFHILSQAKLALISLYWPMGIAYSAHLGGLLGGIVFSLRHLRRHRPCRQTRPSRSRKRRL